MYQIWDFHWQCSVKCDIKEREQACSSIYHALWLGKILPSAKESMRAWGIFTLCKRDGFLTIMVMDGSKEQTLGDFRNKCWQASFYTNETEPYSSWINSCEVAIKELKLTIGRDLRRSKRPLKLWNDCLESHAYIRSFTDHDVFDLKGETPKTMVYVETTDISDFSQCKWYRWVKFRDQ